MERAKGFEPFAENSETSKNHQSSEAVNAGGTQILPQISVPEGQNVAQSVPVSEGKEIEKCPVIGGVCPSLAPLVAEEEMERAKGFEPSTFTLAT